MTAKTSTILFIITGFTLTPVHAGWLDFLFGDKAEEVKEQVEDIKSAGETVKGLSDEDITTGLKQALEKGVGFAVDSLGTADGFLGNSQVAIPVPGKLEKVESALRKIGQDKYADRFVVSMNRAAEAAVPLTRDILKSGISNMTFSDAKQILEGPDDAATRYLQKTGSADLFARIQPIVKRSTDEAGVTGTYKKMVSKLDFAGKYVNTEDYDLDNYVTEKTMDGLFTMIAAEEKKIRDDPAQRTTEILEQVFGSR